MNNLIPFPSANARRRLAPVERGARILVFTGVRYQRMSEDEGAPSPHPPRARRKGQDGELGGVQGGGARQR